MTKKQTSTGFEYELSKERLDNYELLEYIGEIDENPFVLPKIIRLLLGEDQAKALKEHVRTADGIVPAEAIGNELKEIFEQQQVKN